MVIAGSGWSIFLLRMWRGMVKINVGLGGDNMYFLLIMVSMQCSVIRSLRSDLGVIRSSSNHSEIIGASPSLEGLRREKLLIAVVITPLAVLNSSMAILHVS